MSVAASVISVILDTFQEFSYWGSVKASESSVRIVPEQGFEPLKYKSVALLHEPAHSVRLIADKLCGGYKCYYLKANCIIHIAA